MKSSLVKLMNINELKKQVSLGEDSRRQFKADITNTDGWPLGGVPGTVYRTFCSNKNPSLDTISTFG
jgi:hypothetical protein